MQQLIKKYLIISLCCFTLFSCSNYRAKGEPIYNLPNQTVLVPYFDSIQKEFLYTAKIKTYDNQFNGILVVKRVDDNKKRVALITDFGNTLMDFEIFNDEVKVNYMLDDLNKKIIVNKLKKYFQLLVHADYAIEALNKTNDKLIYTSELQSKRVFIYEDTTGNINRLKQVSRFKEKVEIDFYSENSTYADSIHFKSNEIPLEMKFYSRK